MLCLIICLFFPSSLKPFFLRLLGHNVAGGAKIGFSIVYNTRLFLTATSQIGHFNFIYCKRLVMRDQALIRHCNQIRGPLSIIFCTQASIGSLNSVRRANFPIVIGPAMLKLGQLSKITVQHHLDCTRSVIFGNFSTLAGIRSQVWSHGYMHAPSGPGRFRLDGKITIGNNVYIGSGAILMPGVIIGNAVTIGANATVSSNLLEPGFYVNQALRKVPLDYESMAIRYKEISAGVAGEDHVLLKR